MGAIAVGMILRSPAAADGDGRRLVEFENLRRDIGDCMRTITKRRVLGAGAFTIGHAFRNLLYNGWFN
jgi:hypothetical protein